MSIDVVCIRYVCVWPLSCQVRKRRKKNPLMKIQPFLCARKGDDTKFFPALPSVVVLFDALHIFPLLFYVSFFSFTVSLIIYKAPPVHYTMIAKFYLINENAYLGVVLFIYFPPIYFATRILIVRHQFAYKPTYVVHYDPLCLWLRFELISRVQARRDFSLSFLTQHISLVII